METCRKFIFDLSPLFFFFRGVDGGEGGVSFVAATENGFIGGKCEAFNQAVFVCVCVGVCMELTLNHSTSPERGVAFDSTIQSWGREQSSFCLYFGKLRRKRSNTFFSENAIGKAKQHSGSCICCRNVDLIIGSLR